MKKIIEKALAFFAKQILKKYKPEIIGITGSVGKTSTKEVIFQVLKKRYKVRQNIKNYNTEIGVPLTIINAKSGGRNIFKWLVVFYKALKLILIKNKDYIKILILEMAADHPGDIKYLTKLALCKIGVITAIGPSHLEFFETLENVIQEKQILISHLGKSDYAILNVDDNLVYPMRQKTTANILTYGTKSNAKIRAENINYNSNGQGVKCKIVINQEYINAEFKNILSMSQLSSLLAGIAVAKVYGINLNEAVDSLRNFKFPAGRLQIIPGIKNTLIIDDTYNSSPKAVKVALEVLSRLSCSGKRWAVLGDMLELGSYTETAHQEVGEWVKQFKVDRLVVVGERSTDILKTAETNGLNNENVVSFANSKEAGKFLQNEIKERDLILVKGSQGMRMEKIVKEIMAEPLRAKELLVRQDKEWIGK
ncbi:hypothetical protein KKA66_03070 [Patescibacteria group bacterium]|nr:hypothetical protein [Patescibacteria group bacterium]